MLLRTKDKEQLIAIFDTASLPIEVWAYGSRVNGKAHEGSDLDIVIRTANLQRLPIDLYLDLKEKIRESNIHAVKIFNAFLIFVKIFSVRSNSFNYFNLYL